MPKIYWFVRQCFLNVNVSPDILFPTVYFQLLDVVYREETLINVINSVTKNGRSIVLTAVLAVILIYLFSILGYIFFQEDFLMEIDPIKMLGQEESKIFLLIDIGRDTQVKH